MYNVISDMTLVQRRDFDIDSPGWCTVSGLQGMWLTLSGTKLFPVSSAGAVKPVYVVWTESNRDRTVGWTKDVTNTKKLTGLFGEHIATTDMARATALAATATGLAVGDVLETEANTGYLIKNNSSANPVAYVIKASYTLSYFGTDITVVDIQVL